MDADTEQTERDVDDDVRDGDSWMMADDTVGSARALLAKYDKGEPITISEGWLVRFAAALVKRDFTAGPWSEIPRAINFLMEWADDINKSSGLSVDADSLRSIAELLTRLRAQPSPRESLGACLAHPDGCSGQSTRCVRAVPPVSPREVALAIKLIEQRRENYIRENCHTCANGGWWSGTAAQEEYVAELDDIIEMLRTAATKGDDHVG